MERRHSPDWPERRARIFENTRGPLVSGKYLHWDEVLHRDAPAGVSRSGLYKQIPLQGIDEVQFKYAMIDQINEQLHKIDLGAGGLIGMPEQITNADTRDQYIVRSLIDEAITSSQLEGAATTYKAAKEMIRSGRRPSNRSELMIVNNFQTMQQIRMLKSKKLTKSVVFTIHELVTTGTLKDPTAAGRFRRADERIRVIGRDDGTVYHDPPPAAELEERMNAMCAFANGETPAHFVHPVVRSIALHFWLGYDHPFVDGNGRTARALFYWSMLRNKFWLFEFISISEIILKGPSKYARAFLYTESDENDLTYFLVYHLKIIDRAIKSLHDYIARKTKELQALEIELKNMALLNNRQRSLMAHAIRHPNQLYTIQTHRVAQDVTYETARKDLLELRDMGLLTGQKRKKTWLFTPVPDLRERLATLSDS